MTNDHDGLADTLVEFGGEVKALAEEDGRLKIGGYAVLFGTADTPDLSTARDYFTKSTDFGLDVAQKGRVRWHHGLDPKIGRAVLGLVDIKSEHDDVGVWVEGWISATNAWEKKVAEWVKARKAGFSTGVAAHCVGRKAVGDAHEITEWPLGSDISITLTPADPRQKGGVVSLKSLDLADEAKATAMEMEPDADEQAPKVCPTCGQSIPDDMDEDDMARVRGAMKKSLNPHQDNGEPADAALSLLERTARSVAAAEVLVPLWDRAVKARLSEGRHLSPAKQEVAKALEIRHRRIADVLAAMTVPVVPAVDTDAVKAAFAEADKLALLLGQLSMNR